MEFTSACVVGPGRVGSAFAARLSESLPTRLTGRELEVGDADLVVLCVPDRVVHEVAAAIPVGPWIAHTSGARTLDALEPHVRRFSLHPLQTIVHDRGPEQLDGAWAAVSGESAEALEAGFRLAERPPPAALRAGGRGPPRLPRRRGHGAGLPRRAPRGRRGPLRGGRRAAGGARSRSCAGRWRTTSS